MMNARDVAEYLLRLADEDPNNNDITNLKLQKLVYYVQGFHLAMHDAAIFPDNIVPWQYGPVVADLYQYYKLMLRGKFLQMQESCFCCFRKARFPATSQFAA